MKRSWNCILAAACSLWLVGGCAVETERGARAGADRARGALDGPAAAGGDALFDDDESGDAGFAVVDRLFEGDRARIVFDRPLDPGELDLHGTFVAADYVTDRGVEQQIVSRGASLEENRQELVFELAPHELLVEGGRYPIVGRLASGAEVDLGRLELPQARAVEPAASNSFTLPRRPRLPPRFPRVPRLPTDEERTNTDEFFIESISPSDLSSELLPRRDGARPVQFRVTFNRPVACTDNLLPRARAGRDPATDKRVFRVTTRMRDSWRTQLMFMDPANPDPRDMGYRGRVRCERNTSRNRTLVFEVPGVLLGNAETEVHVAATSRDGRWLAEGSFHYDTELPDLFVELTRVQNLRDWSCEGVLDRYKKSRRCDVYVVAYSRALDGVDGVATINLESDDELGDVLQIGRFPIEGAYSNMNADEIVNTAPTRVYEGPVGPNGLDIRLYAFDKDGNKNAANIARIIGYLTSAICAGFQDYCGGDAAEYGAKFHEAMADQVENNSDDHMGQNEVYLRQSGSVPAGWRNWGLDGLGPDYEHPWGARVNVGQVNVWIRIGEATPSWIFTELI